MLSTAAARWPLAGGSGCVARQGRHNAKAKGGGEGSGATRGRPAQPGGGLPAPSGGGAEQRRRQGKQRSRQEVEDDWTFL